MRLLPDQLEAGHSSPEQGLWAAVITQVLLDATSSAVAVDNVHRSRAQVWLLRDVEDFRYVCELAGIDPSSLRRFAQQLENRGWIRRDLPFAQSGRAPMRGIT